MPSNGTKPFFLMSSAMDPNCGGLKTSSRGKIWKKPISSKASDIDTVFSEMDNSSRVHLPAPMILPRDGPILGVNLRQQETRGVGQPAQNGFPGFQFQLPWAPHLSNINIGTPESTTLSSKTKDNNNKLNSIPFDYDMSFGSLLPSLEKPQNASSKLPSIQLASKCFNVIKRQRKENGLASNPLRLGITKFQSISTCNKSVGKRTYAEVSLSRDDSVSIRNTDVSSAKKQRFLKTADALQKSGLLTVTMESASLIQQNRKLQRDIDELKKETLQFIRSVLNNPENRHLKFRASS